jgi:SGNH domain (fused to AT3 domains)
MDQNLTFLVGDKIDKPGTKTLRRQFLATLSTLRKARKSVIVIAPIPRTLNYINIGECLQRTAQGIFVVPILRSDCSFSCDNYLAAQRPVIEFLRTIERLDQLHVVWPEGVTCDHGICAAQIDTTPLYRDGGHITYDASVLLTRMLIADKLDLTLQHPANAVEPESAMQRPPRRPTPLGNQAADAQ